MVRHQLTGALIGAVLSLVLACSGCGLTSGGGPTAGPPSAPASSHTPHSSTSEASEPRQHRTLLSCPARVFSRMTVAQRVGQLFLVGIAAEPGSEVARAVTAYHFGSLIFGTTSTASLAEVRQVTATDQSLASSAACEVGASPMLMRCALVTIQLSWLWRKISMSSTTGSLPEAMRSERTMPGPTDGSW